MNEKRKAKQIPVSDLAWTDRISDPNLRRMLRGPGYAQGRFLVKEDDEGDDPGPETGQATPDKPEPQPKRPRQAR